MIEDSIFLSAEAPACYVHIRRTVWFHHGMTGHMNNKLINKWEVFWPWFQNYYEHYHYLLLLIVRNLMIISQRYIYLSFREGPSLFHAASHLVQILRTTLEHLSAAFGKHISFNCQLRVTLCHKSYHLIKYALCHPVLLLFPLWIIRSRLIVPSVN